MTSLQNLSFHWDKAGNLTERIDGNQNDLTEAFHYDALNRLDSSELGVIPNLAQNLDVNYAPNGNVTYRSDYEAGGTFSYGTSQPHAVTGVAWSVDGCPVSNR